MIRRFVVALAITAIAAIGAPAQAALRVVATTTDLASLVAAVGGDLVAVEAIVPPATDPEAFEPRPSDLDRVRNAALLVRVGLGYDFWVDSLADRAGNKRLTRGGDGYIDASIGIPLLEIRGQSVLNEGGHAHGVANPHYWLDPANAATIGTRVADALIQAVPAQRERIVANRERFLAELDSRRRRWSEVLAPFAGVKLIAFHNSWPYFARRFRLDIVDFIEPKPGVAPSPSRLASLIAAGRKTQVRAIVHEPYEPDDQSRLVARKLGVPFVRLATSVGSMPDTQDYFALLELNVTTLARALSARSQ